MPLLAAILLLATAKGDSLVSALQARLETASAVAMAKHNSGAPVEDRVRERQVILAAVRLAVEKQVDPEVALKVFRDQIEANKLAQRAFLAKWHQRPPFQNAPNLAREVRPKLDALTPKIIDGLRSRRYRTAAELSTTRMNPIYREAWKIATRTLMRSADPQSPSQFVDARLAERTEGPQTGMRPKNPRS